MQRRLEIREITTSDQLERTTAVVRETFAEVAQMLGLTRQNDPSDPAFITLGRMAVMQRKMPFFGLYLDGIQIGCVAVEQAGGEIFYIDRLAVKSTHRHAGYGPGWLISCSIMPGREQKGIAGYGRQPDYVEKLAQKTGFCGNRDQAVRGAALHCLLYG